MLFIKHKVLRIQLCHITNQSVIIHSLVINYGAGFSQFRKFAEGPVGEAAFFEFLVSKGRVFGCLAHVLDSYSRFGFQGFASACQVMKPKDIIVLKAKARQIKISLRPPVMV